MGYRCLNDIRGYCTDPGRQDRYAGGPACSSTGGVHVLQVLSPTICILDPLNCGFFISWLEVCRDIQPIEE